MSKELRVVQAMLEILSKVLIRIRRDFLFISYFCPLPYLITKCTLGRNEKSVKGERERSWHDYLLIHVKQTATSRSNNTYRYIIWTPKFARLTADCTNKYFSYVMQLVKKNTDHQTWSEPNWRHE